jgi:ribosomal protein L11 methyltransferase
MPYTIHIRDAPDAAIDALVELGALDVDRAPAGGLVALMPDAVTPERVARTLAVREVSVTPAAGRDDGSVWTLAPRDVRAGRIHIVPAGTDEPGAVQLIDSAVFGSGLHPTTALCLEMLDGLVSAFAPPSVLDVGTGTGVLALAALTLGVPRAVAIDIDPAALDVAAENARINRLASRLTLLNAGPADVEHAFPLVLANILAAPLIELAPVLVRRVAHRGRLVLSGIPRGMEDEVARAYQRLGMPRAGAAARGGWAAVEMLASW